MHRIANLSLANRSVVALLTVIVGAYGFIALGGLKQELIPSFEVPQAAIVTSYPGASPEVIDSQVSQPIEDAVRKLDGLVNTTSTSQSNLSVVRVEFDYGTKTAEVEDQLNSVLSSLEATLPSDAEPRVISGSFDTVPIIVLAVSATNGDNSELAKEFEDIAVPLFSTVPGVRDVSVSGIKEKRVNLTLDQQVLTANGLSQQSIVAALQSNGFVIPAGTIVDSEGSISVEIGEPVESIKDFENLPLIASAAAVPTFPGMAPAEPKILTVSDVAGVSFEDAPTTSIARTNGKAALAISITKTQDGNTVAVSHGVEDLLPELEESLSVPVTIVTVFDQAPFVEKSLENLTTEGLLGLTFAILVILVFLLSVRSTIVTAISIPTSVLITFIGLANFGYSLNLLTLSALTIAIGRIVDDSIVVIENINRHLAYGEPKAQAVRTAVREVAGAITAATITTVAVFLPIALVDGLVGELFRPFSFTFTIALLASLLVSLTIVPVLAYWFMKPPKSVTAQAAAEKTEQTGAKGKDVAESNVDSTSSAAYAANAPSTRVKRVSKKNELSARELEEERERRSWLQRGYLPILRGTQKRPVVTLVAAAAILGFTFSLVPQLKTNFIGDSGSNSFSITQELEAGATLEQKSRAALKVESILLDTEGVEVVQTTIGSTGDSRVAFGASAGGTSISVTAAEGLDQEQLQAELREKFDARSDIGTVSIGAGGGPAFGSSDTIDIQVSATDDAKLAAGIRAIENAMRGTDNVSKITNSLAEKQRTLKVNVDRVAAAEVGLTEVQVGGYVASLLRPSSIGSINIEKVETEIYVLRADVPETVSEIEDLLVPSLVGPVKLASIAEITEIDAAVSITSEKGNRTAEVSLTPEGDNLGAISAEVTERLAGVNLAVGTTASLGGVSADQAESFQQLGLALLAAVAIVYIVMVATFSSLIQPLILLVSIPFAATGALGLLLLTDTALGVPALIGMLLLVGIVVTNAIVLIDLINQYRRDGRPIREAIMDGSRQRLRPILMTALATIFALTPMALGFTGGGGFISQPLAIVVIGGLFSSTILTLIIVPVLYWLVEGRTERRIARKERRKQRKDARMQKRADRAEERAEKRSVKSHRRKAEYVI